ncbi:MAG: phage tail family protein [Clostridia bacterium]|nr:phage tail family protein [Clostridia bacterium]
MSYIVYKNDLGEITFSGGLSDFSIREIVGLGTPEKSYKTREYLDFSGQKTLSSHFLPRTITMSFDISGKDTSALTAKLYKVLSEEGTLYTYFDTSCRRIIVNQVFVESFTKNSSRSRSFVAQFICDNPYFFDTQTVSLPCYETVKNIKYDQDSGKWNLDTPTIWGAKNNNLLLLNTGDTRAYPTFKIHSLGSSDSANGIELLRVKPNSPTEIIQRFALAYPLTDGETLTISFDPHSDLDRRYLKSSLGVNLLPFRDEDSSLSDFYLEPGENRIILNNLSTGNILSASLSYENQYIEGVY